MKLHQAGAHVLIPDGAPEAEAIARTTHLGIGAHQDDLEFMASHGIFTCYRKSDAWFGGITVTNGGGSARSGRYAGMSDDDMMAVRRDEQDHAAMIGQYAFMAQLDYPSAQVKDRDAIDPVDDLAALLAGARPDTVYTHNPADKHDTHIGVCLKVIEAIRTLPAGQRPKRLLGCEVWRGLDWMQDEDKVVLDVGGHPNLAAALNGVFDSQIAGGKRYDLAVQGRRLANATFFESHATDNLTEAWFAMDLTPLVVDDHLPVETLVLQHLDRFRQDVTDRLTRHTRAH